MKLDKLRTIREELKSEFASLGIKSTIYYHFDRKWNCLDDSTPLDVGTSSCLDKAATEAVAYHLASSRLAWFACPSMECSVCLEFVSSPRLSTRKQSRDRITQVLIRASNAYKVAHNQLTLLLAKDAFRSALQSAIDEAKSHKIASVELQGVDQQKALAVLALDIDHFKQVNDSHGHLYGDQVLKTFAIRLERAAEDWSAKSNGSLDIALGHPSGEEFLVLLLGTASKEQLIDFAEFMRKRISSEPLPSEKEWAWLNERENLSILLPPPLQERVVTASVGVAIYSPSSMGAPSHDEVSQILDQADTALYRAKSGGRNQVIAFDDILTSCGRVLEYDVPTGIVAIDIGRNVGVTVGQEFLVFPPGFTGKRKFQINDGRSTRTIGTYPRFDIARINVFNVQPELSFGFVSDPEDRPVPVEVGSHLEAIPVGSISHLLPRVSKYLSPAVGGVPVGAIDTAVSALGQLNRAGAKPFAVVFRMSKGDQYLKRYGPAALNAALARLYKETTTTFHAASAVAVLDASSVVMTGRAGSYDDRRTTQFVESLVSDLPELGLVAGVFGVREIAKKEGQAPSAVHALEFARFAASDNALTPSSRVTHFDYETAYRILNAQRESRVFAQAQADFEKFASLGLESAGLYNLAGLIYAAQGQGERAAEYFEKAAILDENVAIYRSNFATVATTPSQMDRALRMMSGLTDKVVDGLKTSHVWGYFSYARLLAEASMRGSPEFDPIKFVRVARGALALDEVKNNRSRELIESVVRDLHL